MASSSSRRDHFDLLLKHYDEGKLIALLQVVEPRLGTSRENTDDLELAQALAHRLVNVRMARQFAQPSLMPHLAGVTPFAGFSGSSPVCANLAPRGLSP